MNNISNGFSLANVYLSFKEVFPHFKYSDFFELIFPMELIFDEVPDGYKYDESSSCKYIQGKLVIPKKYKALYLKIENNDKLIRNFTIFFDQIVKIDDYKVRSFIEKLIAIARNDSVFYISFSDVIERWFGFLKAGDDVHRYSELFYEVLYFSLTSKNKRLSTKKTLKIYADENSPEVQANCFKEYTDMVSMYSFNNINRYNALCYLSSEPFLNPYASCELGDLFCYGVDLYFDNKVKMSLEQDFLKAREYYEISASKGHSTALWSLGRLYIQRRFESISPLKSTTLAIEYFENAAIQGCVAAINSLGNLYKDGVIVDTKTIIERDVSKAVELYIKASKRNYIYAFNNLGYVYKNNYDELKLNKEDGEKLSLEQFIKAASLGNDYALNYIAKYHDMENRNFELAYENFKKASKLGNLWAKYNLAYYFYSGKIDESVGHDKLISKKDITVMENLYQEASHGGLLEATIETARFYLERLGNSGSDNNVVNLAKYYIELAKHQDTNRIFNTIIFNLEFDLKRRCKKSF